MVAAHHLQRIEGAAQFCVGLREHVQRPRDIQQLDALQRKDRNRSCHGKAPVSASRVKWRSEEHTSELQSPDHLVCRLLLEKKKKKKLLTSDQRTTYGAIYNMLSTGVQR